MRLMSTEMIIGLVASANQENVALGEEIPDFVPGPFANVKVIPKYMHGPHNISSPWHTEITRLYTTIYIV